MVCTSRCIRSSKRPQFPLVIVCAYWEILHSTIVHLTLRAPAVFTCIYDIKETTKKTKMQVCWSISTFALNLLKITIHLKHFGERTFSVEATVFLQTKASFASYQLESAANSECSLIKDGPRNAPLSHTTLLVSLNGSHWRDPHHYHHRWMNYTSLLVFRRCHTKGQCQTHLI